MRPSPEWKKMTDTIAMLDQAELFQLALTASAAGDGAAAIAYLKAAAGRADATPAAHYLLGAEYAQIGLFDRAIDEMEAALALDPALWTARIQLALLYLAANREDRAADTLQPLADRGQDEALQRFATGLLRLIAEDLTGARDLLIEGMELNKANAALNGDMQRIVDEIGKRIDDAADGEDANAHLLLSAYAGNQTH
jgi:tetratricopeptide (TPR) repeat protein